MKKFLIIGNTNAAQYHNIFPLIKVNKIWLGTQSNMHFINTNKELLKLPSCWYTNLGNNTHTPINLYKHYNPNEYPKYDDYDAINVNKVSDIPIDYYGYMGVPITYLTKHCQEQFEIIGIDKYIEGRLRHGNGHGFYLNGKEVYSRILIKRKI